ncbi:copper chaperone PCu(A)C [Marinicella gelatinilytica]|uniref:copper chaperone PCu(A)C n=1 Tax=Marinicella gelatinilytica TaxID=2996017 RepID=UPI002260B305|nr:copper chaperone PCu(A)C [Marinicella gelatinilytica]MCX7544358.1 copper chaperone PCu(A)C [Marinicella gelatinilytica]
MSSTQASELVLTVEDAWLRAGPPNANMMAAYVKLGNESNETMTLVAADSDAFGMTEIHRTIEVNGVFKMKEQQALPIAAGDVLTMEPGGLHIMLMMPKQAIELGQVVEITLRYETENGESHHQTIDFEVKKQ